MEEINNLNKSLYELEQGNKINKLFEVIFSITIIFVVAGSIFKFQTIEVISLLMLMIVYFQNKYFSLNKKIDILTNTLREIAAKNP